MKKVYLLAFLGLWMITACKKSHSDTSTGTGDPLTAKPWKVAIVDNNTATNPKSGTIIYAAVSSCYMDDTYTFADNGKVTVNNGQNHCTTTEAASAVYDYSINKTDNTITMDRTTFKLAEISETQFKYYAVTPTTSGIQNVVYIFQH